MTKIAEGIIYKGFVITADGGPDAPFIALNMDLGAKFRADTLKGVVDLIKDWEKSLIVNIPARPRT